jgi:hypothetical protein
MSKIGSFVIRAASGAVLGAVALTSGPALAKNACDGLPSYGALKAAAPNAVAALRSDGVGLGNEAWATVVNRDGIFVRSPSPAMLSEISGQAAA